MKKAILLLLISCYLLPLQAQPKKQGDYIESFTNNAPSGMVPRSMQYYPDGNDFVCHNGKNRFTRALYGNHTDYRIETSDFPIFALYHNISKSRNYRSLRFVVNGIQLDEVESCDARYGNGRRSYVLRDQRWGDAAELRVECVAMHNTEGCYWYFSAKGFNQKDITLKSMTCDIANPKLKRNGDIGADKAGCFEPSPTNENLVENETTFQTEAYAVALPVEDKVIGHAITFTMPTAKVAPKKKSKKKAIVSEASAEDTIIAGYLASKDHFEALSKRISFNTPDPYLNTLGSAITMAADGAWDGETWLHGAIGWRMPLAGWRAGYLGDILGWNDRAISHFNAYAASQVTDVEPTIPYPSQDPNQNLARGIEKMGTEMFSTGYICRNPNRNNQVHHYDMNLNYIDELLWHFQYDANLDYMKKMWPVLKRHLAWEKRNFDRDNNHLYDAYCCIWASDALYYNGGEVTHSTAYNYRGNLLAAKIARLIGEDPTPYQQEADGILKAMNESLWVNGSWAEYRDVMGLKRLHEDAAVWSIYTPVDCGVGTPQQMYSATDYVNKNIPHIPVEIKSATRTAATGMEGLSIISTSNWMPYSWSINNVASAEIMHTALAFFEAGRADEALKLVKGNILDQMYLGCSPGNLGQISYYDAARGESYRDFGDNIGISARCIVQGLFGIVPQALDDKCIIRPGFPLSWDSLSVTTPYLSYKYKRTGNTGTLTIRQSFCKPLHLIARINGKEGAYTDYAGTTDTEQVITFTIPAEALTPKSDVPTSVASTANDMPMTFNMSPFELMHFAKISETSIKQAYRVPMQYNSNVTDIFKNQYVSPRPQTTSLEIPIQGIGEWCHPKFTVEINDSVFRENIYDNTFLANGVEFTSPKEGKNIAYASLWDNYPDSLVFPVSKPDKKGRIMGRSAQMVTFLIAGSTNHMQFKIPNATITAEYTDGTESVMTLTPPYNYCPIEQDYYVDGKAFRMDFSPKPLRVSLSTCKVSHDLGRDMNIPSTEVYGRELEGGAAQIVTMLLKPEKKVKQFRLRCLSNDIVVGIMAITMY